MKWTFVIHKKADDLFCARNQIIELITQLPVFK